MGMTRGQKRACRREAFRRTAEAKVVAPGSRRKKRSSSRTRLRRALILTSFAAVLLVILAAKPRSARADFSPPPAPEVDPGSMASALTLLVGGVLTLTGRTRRGS